MNPHQPLIDQLYRERVLRARRRSPAERLNDAIELASSCFGRDDTELRRRMRIVRAMEERDCYGPPLPRA